jgi:hypothetical protein
MMTRRREAGVDSVTTTTGPAVGNNYGVVNYLVGDFSRLRDRVIDLGGLPAELGLTDPVDDSRLVAMFTGRVDLIGRIDQFVTRCSRGGPGRYLLIEAEAGMGKSALATWLAFHRDWPTHVTRIADDPSPEAARANLGAQLIARWGLSERAPGGLLPPDHTSPAWLTGVLHDAARVARARGDGPVVMLVDGLDEAPAPVPGQLPLSLPRQLPVGVVGVVTSRPGAVLPAGLPVERIDVESALNRADLLDHLRRVTDRDPRLAQALASSRIGRDRFCRTLLQRSGGVWIYALSVLDQIRDDNHSPDEVDALPAGLAAYYTNNITRWHHSDSVRWAQELAPLLGVLSAVREARTAADLAAWARIDTSAARSLVRGPLRAFLVTRPGGDPDTYALRHHSLREFCTGQVPPQADEATRHTAHDLAEHTTQAHRRIVEDFTDTSPTGSRVWSDGGTDRAYAVAHLAHHAAVSGYLDELVLDPTFLLSTPLPELLRLRRTLTTGQSAIAALEMAANDWPADTDGRVHWLEVSARKMHATALADAIAAGNPHRFCYPTAATWPGMSHRILTGHTPVLAVASVALPDGRTLLATGSADRTVRLWDPSTGHPVGEPLTGHTSWVRAVASVVLPDGRTLLATGSADRTVRLWDPSTGHPVGEPLTGHTGPVNAVASVALPDGRTLLATGSADRTVRLWDPSTGHPVGEPLTGHTDWVLAVASVALPDGRTLLATGSDDRTMIVWTFNRSPGCVVLS